MESFGDGNLPIEHEWPTRKQLSQLLVNKNINIKLNRIGYKKASDDYPLSGFQLEFTNGVKSDLFQTKYAKKNNLFQKARVDVVMKVR